MLEISKQARRRVRIASELPTQAPPECEAVTAAIHGLPVMEDLGAEQRVAALTAAAAQRNMLEAYITSGAGAADVAKDSQVLHAGTTGTLVAAATTSDPQTGSAAVSRARALRDLPHVQAAYEAGRLSTAHVAAITSHARRIDGFADIEEHVVAMACLVEPGEVRRMMKVLVDQCDPDHLDRDQDTARDKRELSLSQLPSGMWRLDGLLDPVSGQRLSDGLARLMDRPTAADERGPKQRRCDALLDLVGAGLASTDPSGVSQVSLLVDADTLTARLEDGSPIGQLLAELIGCDPDLTVIFGRKTIDGFEPLNLGRLTRRASKAQWRALIARDQGCIRCGKSPRYCEAHHIIGWAAGGLTDLENLCLLCSRCHHDLHLGHYTVTITGGIPKIAPAPGRAPPKAG